MSLAKPAKAEYRRRLPHLQNREATLFITFCTARRWMLPECVRNQVLKHCTYDHRRKLWVHAAVVMPDHVHLLLTPLQDELRSTYSQEEILNGIKGASAHTVNRVLGRRGPVWQDESFDRSLRSSESISRAAEYILENPVRRGLVRNAAEYPWAWREV